MVRSCGLLHVALAATLLLAALPPRAEASVTDRTAQARLEDRRLALDKRTALITDRRGFEAYARTTAGTDTFPLHKLGPASRIRFVESLRFNERGLTTFDYADLVRELGAADLHRVLKPFGFQHLVAVIPDVRVNSDEDRQVLQALKECVSHVTCEGSTQHICTSNC